MVKLDKKTVKRFEREQKEHGTETALHNLLWRLLSDLFREVLRKKRIVTYP